MEKIVEMNIGIGEVCRPTGEIRWQKAPFGSSKTLQQRWSVERIDRTGYQSLHFEWRDVPVAD